MTIFTKVVLFSLPVGGLATGGYLANHFLREKDLKNYSYSEIKNDAKEEDSVKTEFIRKEGVKGQICEILKKGEANEKRISNEGCEELTQKIWGEDKKDQPYLWLRIEKDSFEQELKQYPLLDREDQKIGIGEKWEINNGYMNCESKLDPNNKEKVIISCDHSIAISHPYM